MLLPINIRIFIYSFNNRIIVLDDDFSAHSHFLIVFHFLLSLFHCWTYHHWALFLFFLFFVSDIFLLTIVNSMGIIDFMNLIFLLITHFSSLDGWNRFKSFSIFWDHIIWLCFLIESWLTVTSSFSMLILYHATIIYTIYLILN